MKTTLKIVAAIFALCIGIFLIADSGSGVTGTDAFKMAFQSPMYIIMVLVVLAASFIGAKLALKNSWDEDMKGVGLVIAASVLSAIAIFAKPVSIKTDPKSANLSIEQIQYLKDKGAK